MEDHNNAGRAGTASPESDGPLRYTCDVTAEDVRGLVEFITSRLELVLERHAADSDESRAATSIMKKFRVDHVGLLDSINQSHMHEGGTDTLSRMHYEQAVGEIIETWSALVYLAEPWHRTHGYNGDRWVVPAFGTPKHEATWEETKDEVLGELLPWRKGAPEPR